MFLRSSIYRFLVGSFVALASCTEMSTERACQADDTGFFLPFPRGQSFAVLQGNSGRTSHTGKDRYAWDFDMPMGTPVVAAAPGVVVEVVDNLDRGGWKKGLAEHANQVVIDHGNNLFSVYQHLRKDSARVFVGETVGRGTLLAESGNTGQTSQPHLHFEVIDYGNQSLPICFADAGVPTAGNTYASHNDPGPAAGSLSYLPRDAFRENGILLDSEVPTRFLSGSDIVLRGRVTQDTTHVAALFSPRAGGRARHRIASRVTPAGAFSIHVTLAGLEGQHTFALARRDPRGRFVSSFSVPVFVAEPHVLAAKE